MNEYDEVYHHGVKGMKWGVRRNRKNSARKVAKLQKMRDENLEYYRRNKEGEKKSYEIDSKRYNQLKKEGPKGKLMKSMYGHTDDKKSMDEFGLTMKQLWKEELGRVKNDMDIAIWRGEAFAQKEKALMELDLETASKKDVRRKLFDL